MSFEVDVGVALADQLIQVRFSTNAGITALLGPSGSGKTTILNVIAGLREPRWGRIVVAGRVLTELSDDPSIGDLILPPERRRCGYVFQDTRLFPHLRVRQNLSYGCTPAKAGVQSGLPPSREHMKRLDFLGIDHLLDRWPRSLSGGEARRVAIGRALLSDPAFLLLDEPLSSLDRARRDEVMAALEHLRDHAGLPILLVTHDRSEAERLGAQVVEIG